jgi:hypothetical protein
MTHGNRGSFINISVTSYESYLGGEIQGSLILGHVIAWLVHKLEVQLQLLLHDAVTCSGPEPQAQNTSR